MISVAREDCSDFSRNIVFFTEAHAVSNAGKLTANTAETIMGADNLSSKSGTYDAFISYKQSGDQPVAAGLQTVLQIAHTQGQTHELWPSIVAIDRAGAAQLSPFHTDCLS